MPAANTPDKPVRIKALRRLTEGLFDHDGYVGHVDTALIGPVVSNVKVDYNNPPFIPAHLETSFAALASEPRRRGIRMITARHEATGDTRAYFVHANSKIPTHSNV